MRLGRTPTWTCSFAVLCALVSTHVNAQSKSETSLQVSAQQLRETGSSDLDIKPGIGWEAQIRQTYGRLSLGVGYQSTNLARDKDILNFNATVNTYFLEPRFVAYGADRAALYLAGRVGYGKLKITCDDETICGNDTDDRTTYGGGGGLLVKLTSSVAADLGAQWFQMTNVNIDGWIMYRLGVSIGFNTDTKR